MVDIVILLDRAPSDSDTFEKQKSVILDLIGTLPLPPHSNVARVAVIAYSKKATKVVGFSPSQRRDRILKKVSNVMYSSGASKTAIAMQKAQKEFIRNGRTSARRILISFTDGNSGDAWATASQRAFELESNGIEVHSVALGDNNFDGELLLYARKEDQIYKAGSIGRLSSYIEELTQESVCLKGRLALKVSNNEVSAEIQEDLETLEQSRNNNNCSMDLVMVMDASGSVEDTFSDLKVLAAKIANRLEISSLGGVRLSLIKYAGPGKSRVLIQLRDLMDLNDITRTIQNMTHTSGITATSEALDLANAQFLDRTASGDPTPARKVCLLFTDGFAMKDPMESAERLRKRGVEIFTASSSSENAVGEKELLLITGDESRMFTDESQWKFFDKIDPNCLS